MQCKRHINGNGTQIEKEVLAEKVACFFDKKIRDLLEEVTINEDVYNGTLKVQPENKMFMDPVSVKEVLSSLKNKNSEGYDRIPQRILVDGADFLVRSFEGLFERIYYQKTVPGQWLVSKNIPIFKNKGDKNDIENYRPISNLCSSSKIFEKLILKRILEIQDLFDVDLTNSSQHGFKKTKHNKPLSKNPNYHCSRSG